MALIRSPGVSWKPLGDLLEASNGVLEASWMLLGRLSDAPSPYPPGTSWTPPRRSARNIGSRSCVGSGFGSGVGSGSGEGSTVVFDSSTGGLTSSGH